MNGHQRVRSSGVRFGPAFARPGWRRRWHPLVEALRFVGTTLLYIGCLIELLAATVIAYVIVNGGL